MAFGRLPFVPLERARFAQVGVASPLATWIAVGPAATRGPRTVAIAWAVVLVAAFAFGAPIASASLAVGQPRC